MQWSFKLAKKTVKCNVFKKRLKVMILGFLYPGKMLVPQNAEMAKF